MFSLIKHFGKFIRTTYLKKWDLKLRNEDNAKFVCTVIFLCNKANSLLILPQANTLLPNECSSHYHCLTSLVNTATSFEVSAAERAYVLSFVLVNLCDYYCSTSFTAS